MSYVFFPNQDGQTFLMIASQRGQTEIVKLLLDQPNVDVNAVDNVSGSPIQFILQGFVPVVNV